MALSASVQATMEERSLRLQEATREAHIRALIDALNAWIAEPFNTTLSRRVEAMRKKYKEAIKTGLFGLSKVPVLCRHGVGAMPEGELPAALELMREARKPVSPEAPFGAQEGAVTSLPFAVDSPPW